MPYCWADMSRYSMSSGCSTRISSFSTMASRRNCAARPLRVFGVDLGAVLVVLKAPLALEVAVDLVVDDALGHRDLDGGSSRCLQDLVAGLDALLEPLGRARPP
jgi:hypothetical protein